MLVKVSHESPISILQTSVSYNDYEYCLVHLLDQYPAYYTHYKTAREIYNREVLLDNSIFELGHAFDSDKFLKATIDLKPNMFIVPDVLESALDTMMSFKNWQNDGSIKAVKDVCVTKAIGAVQGKTWQELTECYKFMSDNADMIAISFDFSYYEITGEGWSRLDKWCSGRQRFITQLIDSGIWNWNKPHHLLGCSLPQELQYYINNNIYNIRSVDTSNPIVHGLHGIKYNGTFGLSNKLSIKLADLINAEVSDEQLENIMYNVKCFREITQGCM